MQPVTLDQFKLHCRVDSDAENASMTMYLDAAAVSVGQYLNAVLPLDETAAPPVKSAIMLLAAGLFENRESISERQLYDNETFYRLLSPYRLYS